jgi:hypothetical protein
MRSNTDSCLSETYLAWMDPYTNVEIKTKDSFASYNYITFEGGTNTLTLVRLSGCTSVIVISHKGAWMSHFWEDPMFPDPYHHFDPNGPWSPHGAKFQKYVLDAMEKGLPKEEFPRQRGLNQYAISDLRNNDNLQDDSDDNVKELGHLFDDVNVPRVFIFTPSDRDRPGQPPIYESHVDVMKERLGRIFGNDRLFDNPQVAQVLTYEPMEKPVVPEDLTPGDPGFNTHRGKVLIQYMPAPKACEPNSEAVAQWRMFTEKAEDDGKSTK